MKTLDDLYQEVDSLADEALELWKTTKAALGDRPQMIDVLIGLRDAYDSLDNVRTEVDSLRDEEEADQ